MITAFFVYIIAQSIYYIEIAASEGRPGLIFLTLLLAIAFDQVKSFFFLFVIYTVIIRRFLLLPVNEHEYVKADVLSLPK